MTLAELLIKIRVNVAGAEKLKKAEADLRSAGKTGATAAANIGKLPPQLDKVGKKATTNLKDLESWATRTAVKLDVLSAAMLFMVDTALKAGSQLQKFGLATGIPGQKLLGLQGRGANAGISPAEMQQLVTSLQSQAAQMRLTGAGVGDWGLLSVILGVPVNPAMDPVKLIDRIHQGLMKLRPEKLAYARTIMSSVGFSENIFAGLRNPRFDVEGFKKIYEIASNNAGAMGDLNNEWHGLLNNLNVTKDALVSEFRPEIETTIKAIEGIVKAIAHFVEWLDKGSAGAQVAKGVIGALAIAIPVAALAFTGMAAALGTLAIAGAAATLGLAPVLGTVLAIAGAVGLVVGGIAALSSSGGGFSPGGNTNFRGHGAGRTWFEKNPGGSSGAPSSTTVHNSVSIPVSGASDPYITARAVNDLLKHQLNTAGYTAPAQSR